VSLNEIDNCLSKSMWQDEVINVSIRLWLGEYWMMVEVQVGVELSEMLVKHLWRAVCSSMKWEKPTVAVSFSFLTTRSFKTTLFSIETRHLGISFLGKWRGSIIVVLFKWHPSHFFITSEAAEGDISSAVSRDWIQCSIMMESLRALAIFLITRQLFKTN
jgi:hypothetical protein